MESKFTDSFDLIIVGAGISGINAAYRLQTEVPDVRFTVLEGLGEIGGTWSLFKYPGIRSDSDLYTFGFAWYPWTHSSPIAEGPLILSYMQEAISHYDIDKKIQFHHKVTQIEWSSREQRWSLTVDNSGTIKRYRARFILLGTGYYDYKKPFQTEIPGIENFKGKTIHPQFWPEKFDHANQKMAIIGSGATAVTLLPSLAKTAGRVTMVQRSPSYIVSVANGSREQQQQLPPVHRRRLRRGAVGRLAWILAMFRRFWFLVLTNLSVKLFKHFPNMMKQVLRKRTIEQLPKSLDYDKHFKPRYDIWKQRLCIVPDGDFFKALHQPNTDVVTGDIKTITEHGIQLTDGKTVEADVIITATGLNMRIGAGIPWIVDGKVVNLADKLVWNGCMIQDVPNLAFVVGYTNASWTLGADSTAFIVCRLLKLLKRKGAQTCVPRLEGDMPTTFVPFWNLTSTYSLAAQDHLPKYGTVAPWNPKADTIKDYVHSKWGNITKELVIT